MGQIPEDAIHWDSGDWIEWHRNVTDADERPCDAAAHEDTLARLTALQVSLLRAAKTYFVLTGRHLPVYEAIAEVYAAIHFDAPLGRKAAQQAGIKLLHLSPRSKSNTVEVNLKEAFDLVVVVRVKDNFSVEARLIMRKNLQDRGQGLCSINWQNLPKRS